jgi:two-component system, NtrC family, sensor histidine kinase KinB
VGNSETTILPHLDSSGLALNADARFRHVFAEGFDPILLTDSTGQILDANRQAQTFFGMDRRALLAANIRHLHHPDELMPDPTKLTGSGANSFQSRVIAARQQEDHARPLVLTVEVRARRLTPGREGTWQWIYHDISSRVELESMRQDLIAMLIHDLQSPLGNVISTLELLRFQLESTQEQDMLLLLLDIASRSSAHLQRLISSLLDISRLEAGQPIGKQSAVSIHSLVDDAYEIEGPNFARRGIILERVIAENLPPVYVEESMVSRVLLNLFDNALKYSQEGQEILLESYVVDEMVQISVSDQGDGIPHDSREVIFEKFQRIKNNNSSQGLGLGLAFCRMAVEAHGGRIWVDDSPGGGARFNLTLPIASEDIQPVDDGAEVHS